MAGTPITHFELDAKKQASLQECMDNYDIGDSEAEWPNNLLSRKTVVYESGVIARQGAPVRHAVDPDELEFCRRMAPEVCKIMENRCFGMGSEGSDNFFEFFIAGNVDEPSASKIDEQMIRDSFRGTLFPPITIAIEPMAETGVWWSEVENSYQYDNEADYNNPEWGASVLLKPWRDMISWFCSQPAFVDTAFVRVGEFDLLQNLPEDQWPEGTELIGCVFPRMAVGLTAQGSLVGLFGYTVLLP